MEVPAVDHPNLPPLEPILRTCGGFAHTMGLRALSRVGLKLDDIQENRTAYRLFIRGCHYGYDLAQRRVADEVIAMERQAREAEENLKALRQARNPEYKAAIGYIRVLRQRQLVLRRLIDSVLFAMLVPDEWVLRHFRLDDQIRSIDPDVLRSTVHLATERNRDERLRFSIVSDLTTAVHIGDLVEIDRSSLTSRSWRVIELKTGKVNEVLSSLIQRKKGNVSDEDKASLRDSLGPKAVKQLNRMLVQQNRQKDFETLVQTDQGISPRFGLHIQVAPGVLELDDYSAALNSACNSARKTGLGCARVSGCVYLLALSSDQLAKGGLGAVQHAIYHLANPSLECRLSDKTQALEEIAAGRRIRPIIDLVQVNLNSMQGVPVFAWGPEDTAIDLVMGRISVFAYFDTEAFFKLAAEDDIRLSWIVTPPDAASSKIAAQIPSGPPGAWAVLAKLPSGETVKLLSGLFGRVIVNLTNPKELISMIRRMAAQRG